MPGAFAHITSANLAMDNNALVGMAMPNMAKRILSQRTQYIELGCVSPDYPYLAIASSAQNKWADLMHYEKTGDIIICAIKHCRTLEGDALEKCFAWLCGYMAHVAADITIHPVVELKVGPYEENQTEHRTCEMNQDAYIWPRLGLGEVGLADRVAHNIGSCTDQDGNFDEDITQLWQHCLLQTHPDYCQSTPPDFEAWHSGFQMVVDHAEEGYRFFPWARHVASQYGLLYPRADELDNSYIHALQTPHRTNIHYDELFDIAINNIRYYIEIVGNAVFNNGPYHEIKNWNLDTGRDENGVISMWTEKDS